MKRRLCLTAALCLSLAITGCGNKEKQEFEKEETAINVTVEKAVKKPVKNTVTYTGELIAGESTSVSSKISGPTIQVYKDVGDYVNEGDILLKIDEADYKMQYNSALAAYNQAQAAYNQTQAAYEGAVASYNSVVNGSAEQTKVQLASTLNAAKIEYDSAKENLDRQKVLFESGAISKTVFTAAETQYNAAKIKLDTAQSNYDLTINVVLEESAANAKAGVNSAAAAKKSAASQIESARVALENSQINVEKTTIKAPISGYIASRNANKGQMVASGVEVFSIKSTTTIDAKINVTESIIPYISVGTEANIKVNAANVEKIIGKVSNVSPTKNVSTGMYAVSVAIPNDDEVLKDGMFAEITLTIEESVDALVIPAFSLLEDENGQKYVYVAKKDKAVRKNIEAGIITDEYVEVVSGISKGERIIVSGKEYLSKENNKIRIVK